MEQLIPREPVHGVPTPSSPFALSPSPAELWPRRLKMIHLSSLLPFHGIYDHVVAEILVWSFLRLLPLPLGGMT